MTYSSVCCHGTSSKGKLITLVCWQARRDSAGHKAEKKLDPDIVRYKMSIILALRYFADNTNVATLNIISFELFFQHEI